LAPRTARASGAFDGECDGERDAERDGETAGVVVGAGVEAWQLVRRARRAGSGGVNGAIAAATL
jgi:hypothetical protein